MAPKSTTPLWGVNLDVGYVGFSFQSNDFISIGIAFFEKFQAYGNVPVSHAFIVSGPDSCIEALGTGVQESNLMDRFNNPHIHVMFRKPKGWDKPMGDQIARAARQHVGDHYAYWTILAQAMARNAFGTILNKLTRNWPDRVVSKLLDNKRSEICSELCCLSLRCVPSLRYLGCLNMPPAMISPQQLFGDEQVFEPWKDR